MNVLATSRRIAVAKMADSVMTKYGRIDVLVNNAASVRSLRREITAAEWRRVMDINLLGPFLCCALLPICSASGRAASSIGIGSGPARVADRAAYNASSTVDWTDQNTRRGMGDARRCNAVCPGWSRHRWTIPRRMPPTPTRHHRARPMARFATPDDIAQAIAFLVILRK